ncbi:MAG: 50S ribosomal protein L31 [Actinobacteria bacterium]|nr:50S ribosomal protein L31 [Actinomycetota bacterium]
MVVPLEVPEDLRVLRVRRRQGLYEGAGKLERKHPEPVHANVRCGNCGNEFTIRSTRSEIVVDVCSSCHPAYTGVERAVVHGSRIERFERRRARREPVGTTTQRNGESLV